MMRPRPMSAKPSSQASPASIAALFPNAGALPNKGLDGGGVAANSGGGSGDEDSSDHDDDDDDDDGGVVDDDEIDSDDEDGDEFGAAAVRELRSSGQRQPALVSPQKGIKSSILCVALGLSIIELSPNYW